MCASVLNNPNLEYSVHCVFSPWLYTVPEHSLVPDTGLQAKEGGVCSVLNNTNLE